MIVEINSHSSICQNKVLLTLSCVWAKKHTVFPQNLNFWWFIQLKNYEVKRGYFLLISEINILRIETLVGVKLLLVIGRQCCDFYSYPIISYINHRFIFKYLKHVFISCGALWLAIIVVPLPYTRYLRIWALRWSRPSRMYMCSRRNVLLSYPSP